MNIYSKKQKLKLLLLITAIIIGLASLFYTNLLVSELANEERKKVELWAAGMKELSNADTDQDVSFVFEVVKNNETVPVIVVNENDSILNSRNFKESGVDVLETDTAIIRQAKEDYNIFLRNELEALKEEMEPIELHISNGIKHYIYYKDSILLFKLFIYPFIQLAVIFLFVLVAYFAFSSSRKAEQNQVWVGMSKETAHQLGTPISSLMGWVEMLKLKDADKKMVLEMSKDVKRLETITERFSKIGSAPALTNVNIIDAVKNSVNYIRSRSSENIVFEINLPDNLNQMVDLNNALFAWVIENLCRNAIDAMGGRGKIKVNIIDMTQLVYIDIKDEGKGVPKSKYKTIFNPGYTTKQRGWGLGLSLSKRIVESYHNGRIFVKNSDINKGTTIRIALKK